MDTDDLDLRRALDAAFGDGPDHRPVQDRLTAGRRALLRRRLATAAAGAAVIAVVGTSYAVAGGSDSAQRIDPGYAGSPGASAAPSTTPAGTETGTEATDTGTTPPRLPWDTQFVRYDADQRIELRKGASILQRIRNPADVEPPAVSDALTVRWRGTDYWVVLQGDPGGDSSASIPAAPGGTWGDLATWADAMIAADRAVQPGADATDDPAADFPATVVSFDDGGRLVADAAHRIVEQRTGVDLGTDFAPAGATTALALVTGPDGRRWWLGRIIDGTADYTPYPAVEGQGIEEFLAFARDRYASGEGLR